MTTTFTYNQEQNGVAESLNRTIINSVRPALPTAGMNYAFSPLVVSDEALMQNMLQNSATGTIPLH